MIFRTLMLLGLFLSRIVSAETLESGRVYAGPQKLGVPSLGASLMLPARWNAQLSGERGPLILQSPDGSGRILAEANVSVLGSPLQMLPERMTYYGLKLFSPSQPSALRTSLLYRLYRVEGPGPFTRALVYVVLGPQGRAIVLYGFFTPEGYDGMRQTMISLGDSIGFTPLRALPSHMEGIYQRITGGHFVFYQNNGAFTEKREVWLCRSGKAVLRGVYTVANETSRHTLLRRGEWHLEAEHLQLNFGDGSSERYTVRLDNNTLYFGDAQTFRLPNHTCD
ncbi:hypothetical protein WCX49_02120 [Sulfurimonas sp. HSL-1656]|uniref:hypothetical protein n=1 Tax=Thiomicrolovo subterrani TaxID=3131934 RepID=UPI0031FA0C13